MEDRRAVFGMSAESGRWVYVVLGMVINLCLGSVYSYSIFKPFVEKEFGVKAFLGNLPFMIFLASFSALMFFGGRIMETLGARKLALLGGIIVSIGWVLSAFTKNIYMLTLTYGVIAGAGVGLTYGVPVAMGARWFPDRKGLAVGLILAGFGGSALLTGNIANSWLIPSHGLSGTFLIFGISFAVLLVALSLPMRFPEKGWKPAGWSPSASAAAVADFDTGDMIRTGSFRGLFLCYVIGCLAGLMAICIAKPTGSEVILLPSATAGALVGVFAIANAVGRPLFGVLTDKITPRWAAIVNLSVLVVVSVMMLLASEGSVVLYVTAFIGFWLCLGGWLAIAPTATASFFGMKNYARNYGVLFFAYGLGAILGGVVSGFAKDIFGSYKWAFAPTAGLAVIGLVLAFALVRPPVRLVRRQTVWSGATGPLPQPTAPAAVAGASASMRTATSVGPGQATPGRS
jgi:OFA family oxalate/formate antiporter-like MFS transporter